MTVECRVLCNYSVGVIKSDIGQMGPQVVNAHTHARTHTEIRALNIARSHSMIWIFSCGQNIFHGKWMLIKTETGCFRYPRDDEWLINHFLFFLFRAETRKKNVFNLHCHRKSRITRSGKFKCDARDERNEWHKINCKIHKIVDDNFDTLLKLGNRKRCGKLHKKRSNERRRKTQI